ncbi:MAG: hypothetical protein ACRC80_08495 [Waterburya sp.]
MTNLYSTKTDNLLDSFNTDEYPITEDLENSNSVNPVEASSEDFLFNFDGTETITNELFGSDSSTNSDFSLSSKSTATASDNLTGTAGVMSATGTSSYGDSTWGSPGVWGTPSDDAYYWREQEADNTCAVVAQMSIYESITGEYISEASAADYAKDQGWLNPEGGTPIEYTGSLLNSLGIETTQYSNANIDTVLDAMNSGDKLMAAVDANEIWNPTYDSEGNPYEQTGTTGHTVWVTGVEWNTDDTASFILNDSGTSLGQGNVVDYWDFMNAWGDYENLLTVVDA